MICSYASVAPLWTWKVEADRRPKGIDSIPTLLIHLDSQGCCASPGIHVCHRLPRPTLTKGCLDSYIYTDGIYYKTGTISSPTKKGAAKKGIVPVPCIAWVRRPNRIGPMDWYHNVSCHTDRQRTTLSTPPSFYSKVPSNLVRWPKVDYLSAYVLSYY